MAKYTLFFTVLLTISILFDPCCQSFSMSSPFRSSNNNHNNNNNNDRVKKNQVCTINDMAIFQSNREQHDYNGSMVFSPSSTSSPPPPPPQSSQSSLSQQKSDQLQSRRTVLYRPLIGIILGCTTCFVQSQTTLPHAAAAATTSSSTSTSSKQQQVEDDKSKLYQGFVQLNYLLDHWEQETTICGRSGDNPYISKNGCERTPIKVMDYLGYKDIKHPLFKADKTMRRLEPFVPTDREVEFYEAMESWMIAAEEGNGMAYISSWGEANPGGGKDRVQLFIERARKNVVQARDSLSTIVDIFELNKT